MQKFLTLILSGIVIYIIINNALETFRPLHNQSQTVGGNKEENKTISTEEFKGNFIEKGFSNVLHNILKTEEGRFFIENLITPMDKPLASGTGILQVNSTDFIDSFFKINTFGEGGKGPASCGHVVTISYKILSINNAVLKEDKATIALGSDKIAPGMDSIIVGMREGQTRHATIATKYFTTNPKYQKSYFKLQVSLHKIIPHNFAEGVKIFDDQISYKVPKLCGQKIVCDAKITKLSNNKVLYNSQNNKQRLSIKIGDQNYPMIFSHALHNKTMNGTRTVISKGRFLKSYVSDYSKIFPQTTIPENELYMIEFSNFSE
ncbi:MAG: hypothetical protein DGJ47_001109 [Rickettsiaceae bacterium]